MGGDCAPEACPQCKTPASKFVEQAAGGDMAWADENRICIAKVVDPEILEGLKMNFTGECIEVDMYLLIQYEALKHHS